MATNGITGRAKISMQKFLVPCPVLRPLDNTAWHCIDLTAINFNGKISIDLNGGGLSHMRNWTVQSLPGYLPFVKVTIPLGTFGESA